MEAKVGKPWPSGWFAIAFGSWGIRSDARDFEIVQQAIGGRPEPARMPRLERDTAIELFPQRGEKGAGDPSVEFMARSQLHEKTAETGAQRCDVREERLEQLCTARETVVMRDLARDLYGKPESSRHACGPPFKRRGAMRPIESGIDFDSGKQLRVAREERVARRKAGLVRARNAPSCSPDMDFRGHVASLCTRPA